MNYDANVSPIATPYIHTITMLLAPHCQEEICRLKQAQVCCSLQSLSVPAATNHPPLSAMAPDILCSKVFIYEVFTPKVSIESLVDLDVPQAH